MERKEINLEIVEKLKQFFKENPDIRFFQALQILKLQESCMHLNNQMYIHDNFYEESITTLNRIK